MKAIITQPCEDGSYNEVGMNNRIVTGEYKTVRGLIKFGIPEHYKGRLRIEIFAGNNILGAPIDVIYRTIGSKKPYNHFLCCMVGGNFDVQTFGHADIEKAQRRCDYLTGFYSGANPPVSIYLAEVKEIYRTTV